MRFSADLGARIRELREARGFTQGALGLRVGVDRNTVVRWETGKGSPQAFYVERLSTVFQVSADWLLRGAPLDTSQEVLRTWLETARGQTASREARQWLESVPLRGKAPTPLFYDQLLIAYEAGLRDPGEAADYAALAAARRDPRESR